MPIKLLGIDDNKDLIEVLDLLLTHNKVVPEWEFFTQEEKLLQALTPNVQICLIDFKLRNGTNGNQLIKKIMQTNPYCWFIMMSGQKDINVIIEFINQSYGTRYLEKGTVNFTDQLLFFIKDIVRRIGIVEDFFYEHRLKSIQMRESVSKLKKSINELKDDMR